MYSSDSFYVCIQSGSTWSNQLRITNAGMEDVTLIAVATPTPNASPCTVTTEVFPAYNINAPLNHGQERLMTMSYSNLKSCCVYGPLHYDLAVQGELKAIRQLGKGQVVDSGIDPSVGTSGIAGPGCPCACQNLQKEKLTLAMASFAPTAEEGWLVNQRFLDLPGEPNCRYVWKIHVAWLGQGQGSIYVRDRCTVLLVDKSDRNADGDSPPSEEADYLLTVCGPAVLCTQIKNSVKEGQSHAGSVLLSAELMECVTGSTVECCCGPYPACTCDPAAAPEIVCQLQKEGLLDGWSVDETSGHIVAGKPTSLAGLAYTVKGDASCAYKVRIALELEVSPTCVPVFMGGDYAAVDVGTDGKGGLYAELWVCGGTVFTLLLSGSDGKALFTLAYAGECRIQTPVCCH